MSGGIKAYYTGERQNWGRVKADELPGPVVDELREPDKYIPSPGLISAVNVALTLGQPLLLSGAPGTGKTELALNVARELGLADPLKIAVKSSTTADSILYHFDAARQSRDVSLHGGGPRFDPRAYISFTGLGRAVLLSHPFDKVKDLWDMEVNGTFTGPVRSVVLIDEIDKADRDVPNDLLNEIELCEFTIPELQNRRVKAAKEHWPFVIFTSNAERLLPEAFLRRCIYFHIDPPGRQELERIIQARIPGYPPGCALVADVLKDFLPPLREAGSQAVLSRPPSTAELLSWLRYLRGERIDPGSRLRTVFANTQLQERSIGILAKTHEDCDALARWIGNYLKTDPSFAKAGG